ncbi:MAG: DUF997 family protein [Planctomycetaceae bacterium]
MHNPPEDPVLTSSRREAIIVAVNFVIAISYTIGYCALYAYKGTAADLKFVLGFPEWVFWGVIVPWGACVLFSTIFASLIMRDEDLGEDPTGSGADDLGLGG